MTSRTARAIWKFADAATFHAHLVTASLSVPGLFVDREEVEAALANLKAAEAQLEAALNNEEFDDPEDPQKMKVTVV
jgi:hypothetical protein